MKNLIKLEDLAFFGLSLYYYQQMGISWWWFFLFILTPDIGMLGYLFDQKTGAHLYNVFHHRGIAILLVLAGWLMGNFYLEFAGIILFSHASLDRIFNYGLKYPDGFKHTHLDEL